MRVSFTVGAITVPLDQRSRNIVHSRALGLPSVASLARGSRALNIIGRGPSVANHVDRLRHGVSDKWACGTAWPWCRDNGIDATFVCADAHPLFADLVEGCRRAILAEQCDPAVFEALRDAEAYLYNAADDAAGTTAVTAAVVIGAIAGYQEIRLYGCEGSYGVTTHVNEDQQVNLMIVRCNGQEFRTNPQMIMQSEDLAETMRAAPHLLKDRSGGLLGALVASGGEWELLRWDNAPQNVRAMLRPHEITGFDDADISYLGAAE